MKPHDVKPHPSSARLPRETQLAWRLAELAADPAPIEADVGEMVANRVVDSAAVAAAAIARRPVANARAQAQAHPVVRGAHVFGLGRDTAVSPEWAAWANGVAIRELDYNDTFLAADYAHPSDNIAPLLAVAQHCGVDGARLTRAIAVGYEVQTALVKGVCLHAHKIDHVAHLGPSVAAGLGALLDLPVATTYQAIQQALHVTTATRQSRKGEISSWKAYAPAFAGKMAIEAVDRAMRGEGAPSPAYEGEDGFIAWMLDGGAYSVSLPEPGEAPRAILETYPKAHSAEYQSQAFIDLARRLGPKIGAFERVREVVLHTSHHTHFVIGSGAGDPQKSDPTASRETLDHSIAYIFAVALQDGAWDHEASYAPERAQRPDTVDLWRKIRTVEDAEWSRRYQARQAFGGRAVVTLDDGSIIEDEIAVADAHPLGAAPYRRSDYLAKFGRLAEGVIALPEQHRFLDLATRLPDLHARAVQELTFTVASPAALGARPGRGLFDRA